MYSPFRYSVSIVSKRKPIHLTFFVTRRCNSRCPFCFYLRSDASPVTSAELTLGEIEKISRSMGGLLWLAFSGGEIFLREDLTDIAGTFYVHNRPSIMLFPTNGLLPELIREKMEKVLHRCAGSVIAVKLSLDGLYEDHDRIRNTPGSFEKTMKTYSLLAELLPRYPNFELGINTVFSSENQDSMDNIIDFVKGLGDIRTHTISLIRGDLRDGTFKQVDYGKYLRAIERLETCLKSRDSKIYRFKGARIKAAQDILQRRLIHRTIEEKRRLVPCYAGRLNLVLSEDGEVYPCEILRRSFGNVRDYDFDMKRVTESEEAAKVKSSIRNKECYCTHECYFLTNILFNPALYPGLLREYLQL